MTEPTQEQIKEFWEWCGFEEVQYLDKRGKVCGTHWAHPLAIGGGSGSLPVLDLNNLFKYAVPIAIKKLVELNLRYYIWTETKAIYYLFQAWEIEYKSRKRSFEEALFWAIWEVIKQ